MKKDIRYQILLGGKPDDQVTAEAEEIVVEESLHDESKFRVRIAVDVCNGKLTRFDEDRLKPGKDNLLTVLAVVDGESHVLVHGVITDSKVEMKHGGPGSSLEIQGTDRRVVMGRNCQRNESHNGTVSNIVEQVLNRNGFHDTKIEAVKDEKYSTETQSLNQADSDLELLKSLAGQVGVTFWIDWKYERGRVRETAHFESQPPRNDGLLKSPIPLPPIVPQALPGTPKLTLNTSDPCNTITSFHTNQRTEVPQSGGRILRVDLDRPGRIQKTTVPEPTQAPLGKKPDAPQDLQCSVVTAGGADRAHVRTAAALNDAAWAIEASAESSVYALGALVRPRQVVKVQGSGGSADGDYFVAKVTHTINPADHRLGLELVRNAVGAS